MKTIFSLLLPINNEGFDMRHFRNIEDSELHISVESAISRLSLEADVLSNLLQTFKTTIPSFFNAINNANVMVKGFINSNSQKHNELVKLQKDVIYNLKHIDYVNYSERLITVPENFTGSLLDYSIKLREITKELYLINSTVMVEYNGILSSFITNKDDKISLKDHTAFFKRVQSQREGIVKQLGDFTKSNGVSKTKLKNVLARMSDIEPLIENTLSITRLHTKDVVSNVNSAVDQSTELLDMIIKQVQDGNISNISPNAAMNISKGAFEVAKLVELVAVVFYDCEVLINVNLGIAKSIIDLETR